MTARLRTSPSFLPQRARTGLLALAGPCLWLGLLGLIHALADRTCSLSARLGLSVMVAFGVSACGLLAVLGQRRLQQHATRDPDARYFLLASGTLHVLCALSLLAQLIPVVLGVTCRP